MPQLFQGSETERSPKWTALRMCALFTGGKDSTFALHMAVISGHSIECLAAVKPLDKDSMLYHTPAIEHLRIYEKAYEVPLYLQEGSGDEIYDLELLLEAVKRDFNAEAVSIGAIDSDFQYIRFSRILRKLGMKAYTPLWRRDQISYMRSLPRLGFRYAIIKISAYGLPLRLLGREIDEKATEEIIKLSRKYGFNPAFEGGEAETMVLDAPLMKCRLSLSGNIIKLSEFEGYYSIYNINCSEKAK